MQRNPVKPCAQTSPTVEAANIAKDFYEDFLGDVGGVGWVLETARNQ